MVAMAGRTTPQRGLLSTSWTSESMIGKFDSERVTSPHRAEKFRAYAKERKDLGSTGGHRVPVVWRRTQANHRIIMRY